MFRPIDPVHHPRFSGISTFSRLPLLPEPKKGEVDAAILGLPFDGGTTYRPGARFGPRGIRNASVLCRNYHPEHDLNIYEHLRVADLGDVSANPLNLKKTFTAIEKRVSGLHRNDIRTLCLGGDHSVLLPILRAVHGVHGDFTLIHFDAHTDTADQAWGEEYHHGTPIRRAFDENILKKGRVFQIGVRGPLSAGEQLKEARDLGIRILGMDDFQNAAKNRAFFSAIRKAAGRKPCYLTFDVDGIDPAFAPGTGTPVVGGLTSLEALQSVRKLMGLNFVGADVVEVSPPYDHAEITSLLGAALVFEFLALMANKIK